MLFQKISILPPWRDFFFGLMPHPSGNSSLGSYFPLKILAFRTPLLLGISNDLCAGVLYGYFLEPHILKILYNEVQKLSAIVSKIPGEA